MKRLRAWLVNAPMPIHWGKLDTPHAAFIYWTGTKAFYFCIGELQIQVNWKSTAGIYRRG